MFQNDQRFSMPASSDGQPEVRPLAGKSRQEAGVRGQESGVRMRSPAKRFQDLVVWRKAPQFILSVYGWTEKFPGIEIHDLTSQLRGSAVNIPANSAEGFTKQGKLGKVRFLNIAQGSLEESRYYLILA